MNPELCLQRPHPDMQTVELVKTLSGICAWETTSCFNCNVSGGFALPKLNAKIIERKMAEDKTCYYSMTS